MLVPAGRRIFLKLDVQGYESQVLAGATQLLAHTLAVQLEMSLLPLYEGETLMPQMHAAMTAKGFDLWDLEPSFRDPATGRIIAGARKTPEALPEENNFADSAHLTRTAVRMNGFTPTKMPFGMWLTNCR